MPARSPHSRNSNSGSHRLQIKLLTRPGCHLCDQSLQVLDQFKDRFGFEIEKIDISHSPELLSAYGNDIPVAFLDGEELFRHRAQANLVLKALRAREEMLSIREKQGQER